MADAFPASAGRFAIESVDRRLRGAARGRDGGVDGLIAGGLTALAACAAAWEGAARRTP
jgi:hypothetical protein